MVKDEGFSSIFDLVDVGDLCGSKVEKGFQFYLQRLVFRYRIDITPQTYFDVPQGSHLYLFQFEIVVFFSFLIIFSSKKEFLEKRSKAEKLSYVLFHSSILLPLT